MITTADNEVVVKNMQLQIKKAIQDIFIIEAILLKMNE